jgi:hypothetical protein
MITEFLSCLLGRWSNKAQAFSNPTGFGWILVSWEDVGNGKYLSKQWYHYEGETKPYRERINTICETESGLILENWNADGTRNNKCDVLVTFSLGTWFGKNIGDDCIIRGAVLHSEFELSPGKLLTRDAGYIDNKLIWGSKDYYHFGRLTQR